MRKVYSDFDVEFLLDFSNVSKKTALHTEERVCD